MKTPDDGGPAFPIATEHVQTISNQNGEPVATVSRNLGTHPGLSLRDYFAAAALMGYLAGRNNTRAENPYNFEALQAAKGCYAYADAMLDARKEAQ